MSFDTYFFSFMLLYIVFVGRQIFAKRGTKNF